MPRLTPLQIIAIEIVLSCIYFAIELPFFLVTYNDRFILIESSHLFDLK
jgi:hypothetical protein